MQIMRKKQMNSYVIRRQSFLLFVPLVLVFILVLAACGTNTSAGSGSNITPTPTTVKGYGTANGCPSDAVVPSPGPPNVTLTRANSNSTVTAHVGDVIEVRLPFGQAWSGPTTSQGVLQLQGPAGYAVQAEKVCIWRFVAQGTGTVQLSYSGKAICQGNQPCPQYIINVPFTIEVK